jgi:hypothetical protein
MSAEAIYRTTLALRSRLQNALVSSGDPNASNPGAVFVGPLDDPDANGASLILFLYRMVPSQSLRNTAHVVSDNDPARPPIVYERAIPLDLYYIVTVGTLPGGSEEALLRVLGFAIRELNDSPDLVGAPVAQETVRISMETLTTEEISRIWALFPVANYRTSVAYLASPVWIDPAVVPTAARAVLHELPKVGVQRAYGGAGG